MKIADLMTVKIQQWLAYKGVNATLVDYDVETYMQSDGAPTQQTVVYYRVPSGEQDARIFQGSLRSFIEELDAVEGYR